MMQHEQAQNDPVLQLERLQEILDLDLLAEEEDEILQEALAEATEELGVPIGLISVVFNGAQYFAARHGLQGWLQEVRGTPLEWSFCVHVVRSEAPFLVEDATEDARVAGNPVIQQEGVRSYAGVPLRSSRGHVLGSFCVLSDAARSFSPEEVRKLEAWAERAVARLEERRGRMRG
jgi:GAF domain-containing protein